ncbi:hypothetical protein LXL04_011264 [Taraxacum kok-saghyz]
MYVESMRRLGLWGGTGRIGEFYPERPGTADCACYMRTGTCGYNHPPDRSNKPPLLEELQEAQEGELTQSDQESLLARTGTCKFGASCRFNHPRHVGGSLSSVPLNTYGYPLRGLILKDETRGFVHSCFWCI